MDAIRALTSLGQLESTTAMSRGVLDVPSAAVRHSRGVAGAYSPAEAWSMILKSIPVLLAAEFWIDWIATPHSRARRSGLSTWEESVKKE